MYTIYNEDISTRHCVKRTRERRGLPKRAVDRHITRAVEEGQRFDAFTSWERRYLQQEAFGEAEALAYNGFAYIISRTDGRCITVHPLPEWFGNGHFTTEKERVRDCKKYQKYQPMMEE